MGDMDDFNNAIIEEFRANEGQVGGGFAGAPMLLLHTTGAKSGEERINPMMYLNLDGRIFVFASKAGHHSHPHWYLNLSKHSAVSVELGTESFDATAVALKDPERAKVYATQANAYPGFAEYQEKTSRVIPVVELIRK